MATPKKPKPDRRVGQVAEQLAAVCQECAGLKNVAGELRTQLDAAEKHIKVLEPKLKVTLELRDKIQAECETYRGRAEQAEHSVKCWQKSVQDIEANHAAVLARKDKDAAAMAEVYQANCTLLDAAEQKLGAWQIASVLFVVMAIIEGLALWLGK